MKKWDEPKLVDLSVQNTKDASCSESDYFETVEENAKAGVAALTPGPHLCDKGKGAYTPGKGMTGKVCIYAEGNWGFKCTYPGSGGTQS